MPSSTSGRMRAASRICLSSRRMAATLLSKAKVCSVAASSLVITVPSAWQRRHRSSTVRYLASESVAWGKEAARRERWHWRDFSGTKRLQSAEGSQALPWVGVTNSGPGVLPLTCLSLRLTLYFRPCRPRAAPAERRRWTRFCEPINRRPAAPRPQYDYVTPSPSRAMPMPGSPSLRYSTAAGGGGSNAKLRSGASTIRVERAAARSSPNAVPPYNTRLVTPSTPLTASRRVASIISRIWRSTRCTFTTVWSSCRTKSSPA